MVMRSWAAGLETTAHGAIRTVARVSEEALSETTKTRNTKPMFCKVLFSISLLIGPGLVLAELQAAGQEPERARVRGHPAGREIGRTILTSSASRASGTCFRQGHCRRVGSWC